MNIYLYLHKKSSHIYQNCFLQTVQRTRNTQYHWFVLTISRRSLEMLSEEDTSTRGPSVVASRPAPSTIHVAGGFRLKIWNYFPCSKLKVACSANTKFDNGFNWLSNLGDIAVMWDGTVSSAIKIVNMNVCKAFNSYRMHFCVRLTFAVVVDCCTLLLIKAYNRIMDDTIYGYFNYFNNYNVNDEKFLHTRMNNSSLG